MSEEEQKAIEYAKNIKSWWWDNSPNRVYVINKNDIEQFDIILNLISKQQREIEKLKREKEPSGEFFMSKNGIVIKIIDNRKGDE